MEAQKGRGNRKPEWPWGTNLGQGGGTGGTGGTGVWRHLPVASLLPLAPGRHVAAGMGRLCPSSHPQTPRFRCDVTSLCSSFPLSHSSRAPFPSHCSDFVIACLCRPPTCAWDDTGLVTDTRHGLPGNVPLPLQLSYKLQERGNTVRPCMLFCTQNRWPGTWCMKFRKKCSVHG